MDTLSNVRIRRLADVHGVNTTLAYNTRLAIDVGVCMQRNLLGAIVISAVIAACATKPVNVADNRSIPPR